MSGRRAGSGRERSAARRASRADLPARRSSLMHVGRRVDYAVRALAHLAAQPPERVVARGEIEAAQAIPRSYCAKILRRLVAADVLESVAGVHGGFRLHRAAATITIRQVYEAVEGELCLVDCLRADSCCFADVCTQIDVWRGAQRRLLAYLDGISIADLGDTARLRARLAQRPLTPAPRAVTADQATDVTAKPGTTIDAA